MIHIERIKIVGNSYPGSHVLKKNFEIKCSDVNLFVGNQGCGKSTLLQMLQKNHMNLELKLADHVMDEAVDSFYFDSEKDNPRVKDPNLYTDAQGRNIGIGYGGGLASRFHSHGEVLEQFIIGPLMKAKNSVILLDEPESALSLTNQFKLINAINTAVENKCQLFIATHCYLLIEKFNVISLEHKKQMSGHMFISKIKNSI